MYQCTRNDVARAYIGAHPGFGYVPRWLQAMEDEPGSCDKTVVEAMKLDVSEVVVARLSTSSIEFHARVEVGKRTSECVVRWGSARLPDRLVNPGLDLALACATMKLVELKPARDRFEDLVRSLWGSVRLAGLEYEYKHGELSRIDVLYQVLVEELELYRWWTVDQPRK